MGPGIIVPQRPWPRLNKTVKDMHLCSCYEKMQSQFTWLDQQKIFSDKFLILKFFFSEPKLEQFCSSSEKLFFRVQVWQNNRVFLSSNLQP